MYKELDLDERFAQYYQQARGKNLNRIEQESLVQELKRQGLPGLRFVTSKPNTVKQERRE